VNEIKFACPYCSQHIACDAGYRDFTIDCPACGNSMVVPHLQPSEPAHPAMVVVASMPGPPRPEPAPLPLSSLRSAQDWAQRSRNLAQAAEKTAPHWVLSFLAMLIVLFILRIHHSPPWLLTLCLVAGTALTGWLMVKHRKSNEAYSVLRGLGIAAAVCVLIPVIALGILFIGCLALQ
jgi:hypothetical protein